jgi:hypothetical protein
MSDEDYVWKYRFHDRFIPKRTITVWAASEPEARATALLRWQRIAAKRGVVAPVSDHLVLAWAHGPYHRRPEWQIRRTRMYLPGDPRSQLRRNLGRPLDPGGPRGVWIEEDPWATLKRTQDVIGKALG